MTDDIAEMNQPSDKLLSFRAQIDAIDEQILKLLEERSEVVHQVGQYKRSQGIIGSFVRPGREAEMLRNISWRGAGRLPKEALGPIWRLLIGASTSMEQEMKLSVYAPAGKEALFWLGREYFGPFLPIRKHESTHQLIGDVMQDGATLGILPAPFWEDVEPWWSYLAEGNGSKLKVFACIPFVIQKTDRNLPMALAVGQVTPEPTGHDTSLLVVTTETDISRSRIHDALIKAGLEATLLATHASSSIPERRQHLLKVEDFLEDQDPPLSEFYAKMQEDDSIYCNVIGAYAAPIKIL